MPKLAKLPSHPDLPKLEETVLDFWQKTKAFEKSVQLRSPDKQYVFYDGPPFATGMPHYGNLLGSVGKDVVGRYWTMKGYRVERVWGWDCHGLPIENLLEKKLKIEGGKRGIEKLGVDKFNAACRQEVMRLDKEWEKIISRLGRWVDFKHNYKTMDNSFMESVWWGFKQLYDKKLIYEGKKVILYCPRCATPLSNFEIAMDNSYQEVHEPSTYYKYPVNGENETFLLAWSTTPWNKLATPALAVNPDLTYVKVNQNNEHYYLAKQRLDILKDEPYQIVDELSGHELAKKTFQPHFDFYPKRQPNEKFGVLIADKFVTAEEGTGIVTLAVYGEDDYRVMLEHGVQLIEHVDDQGKLKAEVKPWAGQSIWAVNEAVDTWLEEKGLIYRHQPHTHSVPHCYRCSNRLYYAPLPAWFIDVAKLRPQLLKANQSINWHPDHLKEGRFGQGLATAPDWNISRSRYWGTPMPIWRSADGKQTRIIGSLAELKEWAVQPNQVDELTDLHREFIDEIDVYVDDEKKVVGKRIFEVFDCWVESGSMPFASRHYPFANEQIFEQTYPAQFVCEYIAQTRAWFYTMHVMSVGIFGTHAVENILTTGTLMAEDGSKMSKSKKNYPDPMELINEVGVDSLRLYFMSSSVMKSENVNFNRQEVLEIRKKIFLIWWNVLVFYSMAGGKQVEKWQVIPTSEDVMDRWLISLTEGVTQQVTKLMDDYDLVRASRLLMNTINDLSTWYLRRSRDRLKTASKQGDASRQVLGWALVRLAQLFAPLTPFFAEQVFHQLVDEKSSIHHSDWPEVNQTNIHPKLESEMAEIRKAAEQIHAKRKAANIKLRQPLSKATIKSEIEKPEDNLLAVLAAEANVKEVDWQTDQAGLSVELDLTLTTELKAEGEARELIRSIQNLRRKAGKLPGEAVRVSAPTWPEDFSQQIEQTANCQLVQGEELKIL